MTDEARAEAQRQADAWLRDVQQQPPADAQVDIASGMRAGFERGAAWQAEQDVKLMRDLVLYTEDQARQILTQRTRAEAAEARLARVRVALTSTAPLGADVRKWADVLLSILRQIIDGEETT